jgi:hypothetical protein
MVARLMPTGLRLRKLAVDGIFLPVRSDVRAGQGRRRFHQANDGSGFSGNRIPREGDQREYRFGFLGSARIRAGKLNRVKISRSTAIHEAGHAVAAIRAGLVFDHVTAIADEDLELDGALHWTDLHISGAVAMSPHLEAVVLLAGPCAEAKAMRRRADLVFAGEAATDDRESIASLGLSDEDFIAASRDALELIERDWTLIERIADELLKGRRLQYEEVEAIVVAD